MNDQLFQLILADLADIKSKVNELLIFKYYIYGITAAIATAVSVLIKVVFR